jgi:hypothetical protein
MRRLSVIALALIVAAAAIGCGGSEDGATDGSDAALDRVFDQEEFPARLADEICRVIDARGEDEARRLFVKTWSSDSFEFSGGELFDEAASRC